MSLGGGEIIVLFLLVLVLFGPALVAFWLGYTLGRRRTTEAPSPASAEITPAAEPHAEDTKSPAASIAPAPASAPAPARPEEPTDD